MAQIHINTARTIHLAVECLPIFAGTSVNQRPAEKVLNCCA